MLSRKGNEMRFMTNFRDKLQLIELLCKRPHTVKELSGLTGINERSINRCIQHLRDEGWTVAKTCVKYYQITGISEDFSDTISRVFHLMHTIQRQN